LRSASSAPGLQSTAPSALPSPSRRWRHPSCCPHHKTVLAVTLIAALLAFAGPFHRAAPAPCRGKLFLQSFEPVAQALLILLQVAML
jgi:hypothetical protein